MHYGLYVFRVIIYVEPELGLLRRQLANVTATANALKHAGNARPESDADVDKAAAAVHVYETRFVHLPKHSQYIHKLAIEHPAFGPTARLCKRWVCDVSSAIT